MVLLELLCSSSILQDRFLAATNAYTNPHDLLRHGTFPWHSPAVLFPEEFSYLVSDPWIRILALASVLFFIFTAIMGCEQIEVIRLGRGKIPRLTQSVGRHGTELASVTSEFNEMPLRTWRVGFRTTGTQPMYCGILNRRSRLKCHATYTPHPMSNDGHHDDDVKRVVSAAFVGTINVAIPRSSHS
jgi:hypothetical protein